MTDADRDRIVAWMAEACLRAQAEMTAEEIPVDPSDEPRVYDGEEAVI